MKNQFLASLAFSAGSSSHLCLSVGLPENLYSSYKRMQVIAFRAHLGNP